MHMNRGGRASRLTGISVVAVRSAQISSIRSIGRPQIQTERRRRDTGAHPRRTPWSRPYDLQCPQYTDSISGVGDGRCRWSGVHPGRCSASIGGVGACIGAPSASTLRRTASPPASSCDQERRHVSRPHRCRCADDRRPSARSGSSASVRDGQAIRARRGADGDRVPGRHLEARRRWSLSSTSLSCAADHAGEGLGAGSASATTSIGGLEQRALLSRRAW